MSFVIQLTKEAINDIAGIVGWYDEQKNNLGNKFIEHLHLVFSSIEANPGSFSKFYKQIRKVSLQKFPYIVLFKEEKTSIIILAVFHTSRNPKRIIKRIKK